jgi:hypothetical protein
MYDTVIVLGVCNMFLFHKILKKDCFLKYNNIFNRMNVFGAPPKSRNV